MNTHLKKFFEVVWLCRTFYRVYILKIIMSTPLEKKFFEADRIVLKFFLSADSEKSREYTCKKNSLKPFGCFKPFLGCIF